MDDDSHPLVCVFFQLPPSDRLFMWIHDIPWLILLPQLERLTAALENLLVTNPSPIAMDMLYQARGIMGEKVVPLRNVMLSGRTFSRHYVEFVDAASQKRNLNALAKGVYSLIAEKAAKKTEEARQALSDFRDELESVVRQITVLFADHNNVSLFITESTQIVSVIVTAIEECSALLEECRESFLNFNNQNFDSESFECNPPTEVEIQLVREKWEMLQSFLHENSLDWNLLEGHIQIPHANPQTSNFAPQGVKNPVALTENPANPETTSDIPPQENPADAETAPRTPSSRKAKVPFWRKFIQRVACLSSKPFC